MSDGLQAELSARAFRDAFDTLTTREQEVCVLLYVKHLTLQEVGHVIGVTESEPWFAT